MKGYSLYKQGVCVLLDVCPGFG